METNASPALTALGDPTRQAIVELLSDGRSWAVGELARELPVTRPAVSQHLKVLKQARLVIDEPIGTRRLYRLNPDGIGRLHAELDRFWARTLVAFKREAERSTKETSMQAISTTVQHSIVVEAPLERAFEVYVSQSFANPEHHLLLDTPLEQVILEPRAGGRWYERTVDGRECDWGRVLAFEPPHRLVVSWAIAPDFTPEPDPERASEVELRFIAETPDRTRVELEHRALERHGDGWESLRDAVDGPDGWPDDLRRFAAAVAVAG